MHGCGQVEKEEIEIKIGSSLLSEPLYVPFNSRLLIFLDKGILFIKITTITLKKIFFLVISNKYPEHICG